MEAYEIIEIIRKRRDAFWERQLIDSEDAGVVAEAEYAKRVADEYDSLLNELNRIEKVQLVRIASQPKTESDE
jgi:hypothetical protein